MLTPKMHELLMFVDGHLRKTGCSPSFDEMKVALGLRSKSGIHRLLLALEERGFVRRHHHRARAMEVLRLPHDVSGPAGGDRGDDTEPEAAAAFAPNVIQGDFTARLPRVRIATEVGAVSLPLLGRIAAGLPIEAIRDDQHVEIPSAMLGTGEHFALQIAGDSMIEAGILDGDTVVIRQTDTAENGEIVVALIDDREATLKRLRRRNQSIALEPANSAHKVQIFPPDRVRVQGRLVALLRRY